jgi:hypothetical protein
MKTCSKCKVSKEISEFHKNKSRSDGLDRYCRPCRNIASAIHKDMYPDTRTRLDKEKYDRARLFIEELKLNKPCTDCGIVYPPYVMQFDHLDGTTKTANVASLRNKEKILLEVAKCELVCANCHAIRSYERLHI